MLACQLSCFHTLRSGSLVTPVTIASCTMLPKRGVVPVLLSIAACVQFSHSDDPEASSLAYHRWQEMWDGRRASLPHQCHHRADKSQGQFSCLAHVTALQTGGWDQISHAHVPWGILTPGSGQVYCAVQERSVPLSCLLLAVKDRNRSPAFMIPGLSLSPAWSGEV